MEFYIVNNSRFDDNGFAYGEKIGEVITGNAVKCKECGSYLTGFEWLPPHTVKLSKGKMGDVIFGTFNHFLVSEKFREIYTKHAFHGILSFEPVSIFQLGKEVVKQYYYPKIILSEVLVDIEKSEIIFDGKEQCSTCQKAGRIIKKINGLYFKSDEKIESDIFCTKMLPGDVLFSGQLKEVAKDLLNLSFIDAKHYVPSWII